MRGWARSGASASSCPRKCVNVRDAQSVGVGNAVDDGRVGAHVRAAARHFRRRRHQRKFASKRFGEESRHGGEAALEGAKVFTVSTPFDFRGEHHSARPRLIQKFDNRH